MSQRVSIDINNFMDEIFVSQAIELILAYGLVAICIFAFLESSMLFPYLPAEVVVPVAAGAIVTNWLSLGLFVFVTTAGGTIGALVAYELSRKGKEIADPRLQKYMKLSDKKRKRAVRWFEKWGEPSILWGRFLPGLRSVVSIPAGIAGTPVSKFTAYTALGNAGFYFAVAGIVYYGRTQALGETVRDAVSNSPQQTALLIAVIGVLTMISWWVTDRYRG